MYFVKIGNLYYLRCPGVAEKTAGNSRGLLAMKGIKSMNKLENTWGDNSQGPTQSQNPILRGVPMTSARAASPMVVTMGTSGV